MEQQPERDRPTDEEILQQIREIKDQETRDKPLVSELHVAQGYFELLGQEYDNEVIKKKIIHLKEYSKGIRCVLKDGNCFYRAFSFRLAELIREGMASSQEWAKELLKKAADSKSILATQGYDLEILDDFYEPFHQALHDTSIPLSTLFSTESAYTSDTIVCFLRILTAAVLKRDRDLYEAFILGTEFATLDDFLKVNVEPMGVESDQIHIVSMSNAFGIPIKVANLDSTVITGTQNQGINYHDITPMNDADCVVGAPTLSLLYRPGHYDILY